MNKLLLPLLLFFSLAAQAQYNFKTENKSLVYESVIQNEGSNLKEALHKQLLSTTGITNVEDNGDFLTAEINKLPVRYKDYGYNTLDVSLQLNRPIRARMVVDFREGRYKAKITDIIFITEEEIGNDFPKERFFLRGNGQLKSSKAILEAWMQWINSLRTYSP